MYNPELKIKIYIYKKKNLRKIEEITHFSQPSASENLERTTNVAKLVCNTQLSSIKKYENNMDICSLICFENFKIFCHPFVEV